MAYNILKGTVEFSAGTGSLEGMVELVGDQTIAGGKTFNQRLTASAITLGGTALSHPAITSIASDGANRIITSDGDGTATAQANVTITNSALTASYFSGSGIGLTGLQASEVVGTLSAPQINYGNGLTSSAGALAVSASDGIAVGSGGVSINLSSSGGLSFDSGKVRVDPTDAFMLRTDGQSIATGDKFLVHDDDRNKLTWADGSDIVTFINSQISHPSVAITSYTNSTDNRVLTSVNSTTVNGEANLTFDGTTLNLTGELNATRTTNPSATFTQNADNTFGAVLALRNGRNGSAGVADDFCGGLTFNAQDSTSTNTQYSKISSKISSPTNTSEAGKMIFEVTTAGATSTTYLTLDGAQNAITSSVTTRVASDLIVDATVDIGTGIDSDAKLHVSGSDNSVLAIFETPSSPLVMAITGSGKVAIGGTHLDAKLNVSGSNSDKLISVKSDSANPAFYVSGSGDAYISGSLRAKQLHYTTHKWNHTDSNQAYLRFDSQGVDASPTNNNKMIAPHGGKLIKITWRFQGTGATGTTAFKFHRGVNGQQQIQSAEVELVDVTTTFASDTTYSALFSGSLGFASGDIVGVSINPPFTPGISVATCVWEFDQNN